MPRLIRLAVIAVVCAGTVVRVSLANRNFIADWTFTGSSLAETEPLGDATWTTQNGELTGAPSSPHGGWLLFKNPLQDIQMAASFRCAAGCQAGLRAVEILSATDRGTFIFWGIPKKRAPAR